MRRWKMKKRNTVFVRSVWVMLSIFFTLIVAFISVGAHIAGENSAPINKLLGIQTTKKVQLGDTAGDMEHYKSDYVKRDASGNVLTETDSEGYTYQVKDDEAMRDASKAVAEQTAVEGSVLLWNDNGTLPLSTGAGVSLFGMSSVNYITLGNGSGAMSLTPEYGTLAVALRNKGLSVNMELNTHYMSLLKTYKRALGNYGKEQNYLPWFTVNDAPWSAVESVAESTISSYKDTAVMVISRTSSPEQFQDSWDHEKGHLVKHIAEAFVLDPFGEKVEYLAGYIGRAMFPVAKRFLCEHCRKELDK